MKKAIVQPYCSDQNEPSRPLRKLVEIPDDIKERNQLLKKLFCEHVLDKSDWEGDDPKIRKGRANDYGDLIVEGRFDTFLFVTFIEE